MRAAWAAFERSQGKSILVLALHLGTCTLRPLWCVRAGLWPCCPCIQGICPNVLRRVVRPQVGPQGNLSCRWPFLGTYFAQRLSASSSSSRFLVLLAVRTSRSRLGVLRSRLQRPMSLNASVNHRTVSCRMVPARRRPRRLPWLVSLLAYCLYRVGRPYTGG